jgi:hypothetical protein
MGTQSNYALRLPASLKLGAERVAREDGSTLNQFIVSAVAEKIASLKTADYFTQRAATGNVAKALAFLNRKGGVEPQAGAEWVAPKRPSRATKSA